MKRFILSLAIGCCMLVQAKVAYLVPAADTDILSLPYEHYVTNDNGIPRQFEQSPERRAWNWFNEWFVASNEGQFICLNDLTSIPSDIHAIWIYVDRVDFGTNAFDALFASHIGELQAFVNNGGSLFLCKQATRLEKDLVGATDSQGQVIVPDYNDGNYQGAATWGVDFRFEFPDEVVWSNVNHPMFKYAPYKDDNYAELIWTNGGMLTDHNCGFGIGAMDMDSVKDITGLTTFQNRNNCLVLGAWANGEGCHYGGAIEFLPTTQRKGTVITMGLAAYSWINNNGGNGWVNTQVITRSTLRYLENLHTQANHAAVAYLLPSSILSLAGWYGGEQPEYNAAVWFRDNYVNTGKGRFVSMEELPDLVAQGVTTLWVNIERVGITTEDGLLHDYPDKLKAYIQAGGNVLLTKQATYLTYSMGRIGYAPAFNSAPDYTTDDRGQLRSIQTVMGLSDCVAIDEHLDMSTHPIFNDMLSYWDTKNMFFVGPECRKTYDYCSWTDYFRANDEDTHYDNCLIQRLRDFETDWHATVLATQGGIGDYCLSNIILFNPINEWTGHILTIGSAAYQWGTSNNGVERQNMETLTSNCLAWLAGEQVEEKLYTRDMEAGTYGTICFDYAVASDNIDGAEMYEIYSFDSRGDSVILTRASSMEPGKPYIYYATASQLRLSYSGMREEAKQHNGLIGFIGWSETDTHAVEEGYFVVDNNRLQIVEGSNPIVLSPRYAYVDSATIPTYTEMPQTEYRMIKIDKTSLSAVENVSSNDMKIGIYDLLGRKVIAPEVPGIYIINGQRTMVTVP